MNKVYKVVGNGRWCGEYWTILYLRTYNKELALNFAKKHSDSFKVIELGSVIFVSLYGGDKGW